MKIRVVSSLEIWKPIPGFIGYGASTHGRIRSYRSRNGRGPLVKLPRILKQTAISNKLYLQVTLSIGDGKYYQARVHQVILLTFIGSRPNPSYDGCHNNGNPKDNHISNLRWDTKTSNCADQLIHGTRPLGSKSHLSVLSDDQVLYIKSCIPEWERGMGKKFAELFGVSTSLISDIKNNLLWKHL